MNAMEILEKQLREVSEWIAREEEKISEIEERILSDQELIDEGRANISAKKNSISSYQDVLNALLAEKKAHQLAAQKYCEGLEGEQLEKAESFCKALGVELESAEEEKETSTTEIHAVT